MTAPRGSISQRLTRDLSIWVGILWLTMSVGVTLYVQREIEEACDESLSVSAARLLELAAHEVDEVREHKGDAAPTVLGSLGGSAAQHMDLRSLTYQILTTSRAVLLRSADAPSADMSPGASRGFSLTDQWRIYTLQHPTEPLLIHVADSVAHRNEERRVAWLWMLLPLLGAFPFIAWIIRRVTRHSLAPVEGLVAEIAKRGVTNMDPVAGKELPAEMQMIQESTNNLLVKLKEALEVERSLAANAAHELRTPLAAARLRIANALDQPLPATAREAMDEAVASLDRLARRAEKLLQMSRAETSAALAREPVDLGALACDVAEDFWRDPDAFKRLKVQIDSDEPITTVGDYDALALALRNLIENALRYADGASVKVKVMLPATIVVRDLGPGVNPETLAVMSTRHIRRSSDQAGYGLGLSIVKTVVERHGGRMDLRSPAPGHPTGFAAILDFPPASSSGASNGAAR